MPRACLSTLLHARRAALAHEVVRIILSGGSETTLAVSPASLARLARRIRGAPPGRVAVEHQHHVAGEAADLFGLLQREGGTERRDDVA